MLLDTRPPEGGPEVQSTLKRGGIPEKTKGIGGKGGEGGRTSVSLESPLLLIFLILILLLVVVVV